MDRRVGFLFGWAGLGLVLGGAWLVVDATPSAPTLAPVREVVTRPRGVPLPGPNDATGSPGPSLPVVPSVWESAGPVALLPPAGFLSGCVVDDRGQAVPGVTLRFRSTESHLWRRNWRPPPTVVLTSDEDGGFEIAELPEGGYVVSATRVGYHGVKQRVSSPANHRLDFLLVAAARTQLEIVDALTGHALPGASVTPVRHENSEQLAANVRVVTHPPAGSCTVWVNAPRYIMSQVKLDERQPGSVDRRLVRLRRAPEMTVTVTDGTGRPLPGVAVAVDGEAASGVNGKTNEEGQLNLVTTDSGTWTIHVGGQSQVAWIEQDD